jgi:hypothetical protein
MKNWTPRPPTDQRDVNVQSILTRCGVSPRLGIHRPNPRISRKRPRDDRRSHQTTSTGCQGGQHGIHPFGQGGGESTAELGKEGLGTAYLACERQ